MLAELLDQHIDITGEFIAELEQYMGAPAPAYLPARITEMKQVFRLANSNFQAGYKENICYPVGSLRIRFLKKRI